MKVGIPKEVLEGEKRVALVPALVGPMIKKGYEIFIETGAGENASFLDADYEKAGAKIVKDVTELYNSVDAIFKVQPPMKHPKTGKDEADMVKDGTYFMGFLYPLVNKETVNKFKSKKVISIAMEYVPRISRAQSMDALSSQANIAGYKAVLLAADHIGKVFPLLMTAAGTIPPAVTLILGAGVAGLQAIATAKRLGSKVEAFDPRPVVKEQVESLGATFIEMEMPEDAETTGGYAKEMSPEFIKKEMEAIGARLPKVDVVISTAQIFGKKAPTLMTEDMVKMMRPGTVIVDLAAEQGGNCTLTEPGKVVEKHGVSIIGTLNLPSLVAFHSSQMYAKNIQNLTYQLFQGDDKHLDFEDEVTKGAVITHNGEIQNEMVKKSF